MMLLVQPGRRVAAALGVLFLGLAVILGSRYSRDRGGWDVESGSNDMMTIMLLVLGAVLALSFALFRPGARNIDGASLTSFVWTIAILAALLFT